MVALMIFLSFIFTAIISNGDPCLRLPKGPAYDVTDKHERRS